MTEFRTKAEPPASAPLAALWWVARGDWKKAHEAVQSVEDGSADSHAAAWVHAHLHRLEGDLSNAAYWYGRAQKPVQTGPLDAEWDAIAAALDRSAP